MYRQSWKNLLNSNLPTSLQYGELRPTSGWDLLAGLGHPNKFQRLSHLGSVTARHSSRGRQPNFAALNRGRHLYSAGWSSRWALAHISSCLCCWHFLLALTMLVRWLRHLAHKKSVPHTSKDSAVEQVKEGNCERLANPFWPGISC